MRIGGTRIGLPRRLRALAGLLLPQQAAANAGAYPGVAPPVETQAGTSALRGLSEAAQRNLAAEQERWLPWCVVAFGAGIAIYFALPSEPSLVLVGVVAVAASACAWGRAGNAGTAMRFFCAAIAAGGLGFAAAKLRSSRIDAPIIAHDMGPVRLTASIRPTA